MDFENLLTEYATQHKQEKWSQQRMLHECLRAGIQEKVLGAGLRLPASRQLATELGMARNSIVYAYDQLIVEGYVRSDRRGTYVAELDVAPILAERSARKGNADIVRGLSDRAYVAHGEAHSASMAAFAPGMPSLADFPMNIWRRCLDRAWRRASIGQLSYGDPSGASELRIALAEYLRVARGVRCDASQVFVTEGTQSSLDLCCHAFADAGDTVWTENPSYNGAMAAFHNAQLRIVGINVDADGMAPNVRDWQETLPKLIYLTPSHQYPLGSVLSLPRRLAMIDMASRHGAMIVEDDYDSEFRHDGPPLPALQGLAIDAPVLYLGTFSKTMFPALRIGFVVVPTTVATAFDAHISHSQARGRTIEQLALADFIRSGEFSKHLRRTRKLYKERRAALLGALHTSLQQHLGKLALIGGDSAGMHLVLHLDPRISDIEVSAQAQSLGVVVPALSSYQVPNSDARCNGLVLGYAQVPEVIIERSVKLLCNIIRRMARTI